MEWNGSKLEEKDCLKKNDKKDRRRLEQDDDITKRCELYQLCE